VTHSFIAVIGSGGQLGSELLRQLGAAAVGLDLPHFDLTERLGVLATLQSLRPQAVINTAAYTRVDEAETAPERCWAINADGVAHLAEACRALNCPLVQISTDYVFGGDVRRRTPYREDDAPGPQGVYAQSKLAGERNAAPWERHFIVRTCGLYGPPPARVRPAISSRPCSAWRKQPSGSAWLPTNIARPATRGTWPEPLVFSC